MNAVVITFFTLTVLGTIYYILSAAAIISAQSRQSSGTIYSERVSILKPVSGIDTEAADNFISYLNQDYHDYEVLFGVLDPNDPSIPVIRKIIADKPFASLHIGAQIPGANNKVRILHNLASHASGKVLVITDADTRVGPGFLREVTAPFEDNSTGVVTCMYRGIDAGTIADALEGLHMTCIFAPGVASAHALRGIDFGLGAAIAIKRKVLDDIGGFEPIADYLADDFQLGRRTAKLGYKVELSTYITDIVLSHQSFRDTITRELRWSRTTRISRPLGHFGLIVTFGFTYALAFLCSAGFSLLGWSVLFGVMAIRMFTAFTGARYLGDREFLRLFYLLPIRDLLSFGIWVAGYFSNTITWRGRKLRLTKNGQMEPFI